MKNGHSGYFKTGLRNRFRFYGGGPAIKDNQRMGIRISAARKNR